MEKFIELENQQTICKEVALGWLAGILEGEGMLTLGMVDRRNIELCPRISITNSDKILIECVLKIDKSFIGGAHVRWRTVEKSRKPHYKPVANVTWDGYKRTNRFLLEIVPYILGNKRKLAELLLKFVQERLERPHYHSPHNIELVTEILKNTNGGITPHRQRLLTKLSEISDRTVPNRGHLSEAQKAKARNRWFNPVLQETVKEFTGLVDANTEQRSSQPCQELDVKVNVNK